MVGAIWVRKIVLNVGENGFGSRTSGEDVIGVYFQSEVLEDKVYLITGTNAGIGYDTARALLLGGSHVILHARSSQKVEATKQALIREITGLLSSSSPSLSSSSSSIRSPLSSLSAAALTSHLEKKIGGVACDLSSLVEVASCVEQWKELQLPLDGVILNAGVMGPPERVVTVDGLEIQLGVNHFAHFALTHALLPDLVQRAQQTGRKSRVVAVSSTAALYSDGQFLHSPQLEKTDDYPLSGMGHYTDSKLANVLFAKELHRRYFAQGIVAVSLHPGVIITELQRTSPVIKALLPLFSYFIKDSSQGAATSVYCAVSPLVVSQSGQYFLDCNPYDTSSYGIHQFVADDAITANFWNTTVAILQAIPHLPPLLKNALQV